MQTLTPFQIKADLPAIVANEAAAAGLPGAPERLMYSVFKHETGAAHSRVYGFAGTNFAILGIDWATPGDRSHFVEEKTSGRQLSFSRGWGISQTTLFTEEGPKRRSFVAAEPDPAQPGQFIAGQKRLYRTVSGIPMAEPDDSGPPVPFFIASAGMAANSGVQIYISKFKATQKSRDCTYGPKKYDCENCIKNLNTGPATGVQKGGMQFFDESLGDFDRVVVGKNLASHKIRTTERLAQLMKTGPYTIPGKTPETVSADDTYEFPCSWLTAITLYAGVGEIAWYYPLDRIYAIANGKG